ncbi:MAG: glycosyltransferase family 4 protein [Pseudomonadota bacterium]
MSIHPLRVTFVVPIDHSIILHGGLQIQVSETAAALRALGIEVRMFDAATTDLGDVVHFFGCCSYFWEVARIAIDRGVPFCCSTVFSSAKSGLDLSLSAIVKRLKMSYPHDQRRLLKHARRVFTLSAVEEESLRRFFGLEDRTMVRVPNGMSASEAGDAQAFRDTYGMHEPFVLQVASFYRNKRQKALIEIANRGGKHAVFIGGAFDPAYMQACRRIAGPTVHILGEIPYGSSLIAGAYAAAKVFCLPSKREVMSLAAIEAAKAGLPMVLGDRWGAREYFGDDARYVSPDDSAATEAALNAAWQESPERRERRRQKYMHGFRWDEAARKLLVEYEAIKAEQRRAGRLPAQSPLRARTATITW